MFKLREIQKQKQSKPAPNAGSNTNTRLHRDLKSLELPPTTQLHIVRGTDDSIPLLQLAVKPDEGYYKGGNFTFELLFNEQYPMEPPKVKCLNRIYHPNIDTDGRVCLNILRQDWTPALDLQSVIIGLLFLFLEISGVDPLNKQAAETFNRNRQNFAHAVRQSMGGNTIDNIHYDKVTNF
ncbi:hypothetical protein ZYGR_0AD06000 [Zygosaccharomyces rouxii]|uniref:NEDD8-conjugating enzyme UBC12 n=2 Tax=Zygosaccharomyces rouxii TaxID=4956 RepID=C5E1C6_ZYGRC|nr:uncharacterized protein ZYRO0G19910g [Zygosaccharomyces rouxii]KAH9202903.1 ubiquitin-conjugating enzyme/RWD-like protein [Zygosaccharomyces rouxii]GAV51417.1 hypothetical protein ZYGR_0AD06000 [Zygosaccharomyces rouxii]CAR29910.1 ZYRO0G19910p [Zygosaccharomyces rouxii]